MNNIYCRTGRIACILVSLCIGAFSSHSVAADSSKLKDQEVDQLLVEQQQKIKELEERISNMESAAMSARGVVPASTGQPDSESRQTLIESSDADTSQSHTLLSGSELASSDFPGSWPMFGTDMRMKIGGYLKTDAVFDFDGTTDPTQFLMSTIPVKGSPEYGDDGYFTAFSQESRFNIDVRRVTPGAVPLRAFVEGDFWGGKFRLRHAYMTVNNFLVGQTWSTLSLLETLPFVIDFAAGDALFGGRTSQVRYQMKPTENWKLAFAAEAIDYLGIENPNNLPGKANTQFPLLAARADYSWETGVVIIGASVAELHWDGGSAGSRDKATQVAVVVGGRQFLGSDNYFTWNLSKGDGAGENIMAFTGSNANAVLEADGKLDTMPSTSVLVGFWHRWNQELSSNFSYAYGWLDTPDSRDPLALQDGGIGHVNLIWKPVTQFSCGAEYMWGKRRASNDELGSADRLQFMAKYEF